MTCMKKDLLDEAHVLDVKPETVVSESHIIREFDLNDRNLTAANCCEFEGDFSLTVKVR